jgi:ABC-type dipeptide/oligopeptide/nickel transport system permease component
MSVALYAGRRILWAVPTFIGALVVIFLLTQAVPGNAALARVGNFVDPDTLAAVKRSMGIDQPIGVQFVTYVVHLFQGNLGFSWKTGNPVTVDLAARLPATLELAVWTLILAIPVGVGLGVLSAALRGTWISRAVDVYALLGLGIPQFWLSLMCVYVFYFVLGWVAAPAGRLGILDTPPPAVTGSYVIDSLLAADGNVLMQSVGHLVLPVLSLAFVTAAPITRLTATALTNELDSDYARAEIASGIPHMTIVTKYALRNILVPVLTMVGLTARNLLAGAIITEFVFAWPGIGRYAIESMQVADLAPLQAVVLIVALATLLINLLVDLSYYWIDPRIGVARA